MAVTVKDVAQLANVTPTVVSRVLHSKALSVRVSPATAERVKQAAEQLGYRVNVMARNFRAQQTKTLGVMNGQGMQRPTFLKGPRYFAALMDGIVDGAFGHGFSVTLCPLLLGEHPEEGISDGRFDGLIWYSIAPSPETIQVLESCSAPLVIVHAHAESFNNQFPTVICDNRQGVGLAIDHLVEQGHKRIGFAIEGDAMNVESEERLDGYKLHMARHGLSVGDDDVIDIAYRDRSALHDYLEAPRHTAVVCHADGLASDFIRTAPLHGVKVPTDLAIVGFDSTEFCDELRPSLTSISQPLFDLGWRATEQLMKIISGEGRPDPLELVLPCGLDVRGSTMSNLPTGEY